MPDEKWGEKTRSQYLTYLRNLRACNLSTMAVSQIEGAQAVLALDKLTDGRRMRNVYRHLMVKIFRYAVEMGWCHDNPAEVTRVVNDSRDGKVCPFIIHHRPRRIPKKKAEKREHPMQLFVDKLGKEFSKARNKSGFYAHAKAPPPTFYEIKSLGGDRYRQMAGQNQPYKRCMGTRTEKRLRAIGKGKATNRRGRTWVTG